MKEMTSVASAMMTEEEKAEMEAEMHGETTTPDATKPSAPASVSAEAAPRTSTTAKAEPVATPANHTLHTEPEAHTYPPATTPVASTSETPTTGLATASKPSTSTPPTPGRPSKLSVEQRQKLDEINLARQLAMEKRIEELTEKLKSRLSDIVDSPNPGGKDDPKTKEFEEKMRQEAEALKIESFGIELLHTIGASGLWMGVGHLKLTNFCRQHVHHEGLWIPQVEEVPWRVCLLPAQSIRPSLIHLSQTWFLCKTEGEGCCSKRCMGSRG